MTPRERADLQRQVAHLTEMIERVEAMLASSDVNVGAESPVHKALVAEMRTMNARLERLCGSVEQLVDELRPKKKAPAMVGA